MVTMCSFSLGLWSMHGFWALGAEFTFDSTVACHESAGWMLLLLCFIF